MNLIDIERRLAVLADEHREADSNLDLEHLGRLADEMISLQDHALTL